MKHILSTIHRNENMKPECRYGCCCTSSINSRIIVQGLGSIDTRKENKPLFCYLCGPPNMIKDIARILIDLGVPKKRVIYEMWW